MATRTITYDQAVSFTSRLLDLRKASPFSWQAGPGVKVRVVPHRDLLDAVNERLQFCDDPTLQTVRFDLEVSEGGGKWDTAIYLSTGNWSESARALFPNGFSHYLLIHDRLRRSVQQINLRRYLVQSSDQMRLHLLPRFPKGGADLSQRLLSWMMKNAPVTVRGKELDLGLITESRQLLQNLLLVGLAKQHLRRLQCFRSWMESLPPFGEESVNGSKLITLDDDDNVVDDAASALLATEDLDDEVEEEPAVWIGLRLVDPPTGRRIKGRRGGAGKGDFAEIHHLALSIGSAGERLVLAAEKAELVEQERPDLAEKVQHVAAENDGAGYDILSFTPSGKRIYIEVKTTTGGERAAFFLTANELAFSRKHKGSYRLYRLFGYAENPERASMFILSGDLSEQVELEPTEYRVRVKGKKRRGGTRG